MEKSAVAINGLTIPEGIRDRDIGGMEELRREPPVNEFAAGFGC